MRLKVFKVYVFATTPMMYVNPMETMIMMACLLGKYRRIRL